MSKSRSWSAAKPLALATMLGAGFIGTQAWANTAANSGILNTVSVAFNDAGGTAQTPITASVTVTVNLVPASPTLSAPADQTIASGGTATYNYTLTNNSNGIETFTLTTSDTPSAGITPGTSTATPSPASVTVGASTVAVATTIAASGNTTITVPSDLTPDSSINGLVAGNKVMIGGQLFTIASIGSDTVGTDVPNGTTTITVTGNGAALAVTVGELIDQQVAFTLAVTSGTDTTSNVNQTDTVVLTATDGAHPTATANDSTTTTVAGVGLTVTKYVRNVGNAAGNSAGTGSLVFGGSTYYTGGVTGNPSDTLEYLIQVVKGSSASTATSVIVSDPVLNFVTYTASSLKIDACNGTLAAATDTADADQGTYTAGTNTVSFYPGAGGKGSPATGGSIAASTTCSMVYRVTIQ